MVDKIYCAHCNKMTEGQNISKEESFNVKGDDITITSSLMVCKQCNKEVFVEAVEERNLEKAYMAYRNLHKLLTPAQIKEIREQYGLSQRSLGKLLGWGEITIHRYESGNLQDEAHDEVLKLISRPENLLEIYEKQAHLLPNYVSESLRKRIDELIKKEIQPNFNKILEQMFISERKSGEFTGYKDFDLEKIADRYEDIYRVLIKKNKTRITITLKNTGILRNRISLICIGRIITRYLAYQKS